MKFTKFKLLKNYLLYYFKGTHQGLNISHVHANTAHTLSSTKHIQIELQNDTSVGDNVAKLVSALVG